MADTHAPLVVVDDSSLDERLVVELHQRITAHLKRLSLSSQVVAVSLVAPARMRMLNREYHAVDAPTDVLSFPYRDPQSQVTSEPFIMVEEAQDFLGDIALCVAVAGEQALQKGVSLLDELEFLFTHGLEHLLGHHHD